MFANERQQQVTEMIRKHGAVTVSTLMNTFGVSIETVRRDLLALEKQGVLTRVHGGAVTKNDMKPFLGLSQRNKEYEAQKRELALAAMSYIENGDIIAIDSGSTAIVFAETLRERFSRLTVVTHSLDVFHLLCNYNEIRVILCGGHYLRSENAFYGALTLDMLNQLHVQKAFLFPSAVSLDGGIADFEKDLFQVQRELFACADAVFVLADSSKFEKKGLLKVDDMRREYHYITDSNLSEELQQLYRENSIQLTVGV